MLAFRRNILLAWVLLLLMFPAACAHYPVNARVGEGPVRLLDETRFRSPGRSDELLVFLAFSGGGTRAAALSFGVLEALARVEIPVEPIRSTDPAAGNRRLLDEVDGISSVSGGSFTAAYYGLHGDRIFSDFKERFLTRNVQKSLFLKALSPYHWLRTRSSRFGRSDLAAEYYDEVLFDGKTLGDFDATGGPRIWIMATDILDGLSFSFSPYLFALTCMDYDSFPVARAVAASAAFPGPFTPIVLNNYAGTCGVEMESWVTHALAERTPASRAYGLAMQYQTYADPKGKPHIYLLDGGISDNLGVRGATELLRARGVQSFEELGLGNVRRELIIVVDASSRSGYKWGPTGKVPGLKGILSSTSNVMLSSTNYDTLYLLHQYTRQWNEEYRARYPDRPELKSHIVHLKFEDLEDETERVYFNNVPTSLYLPGETVDKIREAAGRLLFQNREFRAFVEDLNGRIPE